MSRRYPTPVTRGSGVVLGVLVLALGALTSYLSWSAVSDLTSPRATAVVVDVSAGSCGGGRYSPSYDCWETQTARYERDGDEVVGPVRDGPVSRRTTDP